MRLPGRLRHRLRSFMGNVIMDALHTHDVCIVGSTRYDNSFRKESAAVLEELRSRRTAP